MPAVTVFKNFSTRPFAGDDLQIVCLIVGVWRFVQLICIIPLAINAMLRRLRGQDLNINGYPVWCPQYYTEYPEAFVMDEHSTVGKKLFAEIFTAGASFYTIIDCCWLLAVWSIASSVGTPTQSRERDKHLKCLIIFRIFIGNIIPLALVVYAAVFVSALRKDNYGCGEVTPKWYVEDSPYYKLFCVLGILYFIELSIFPTILSNKIWRYLSRNRFTKKHHFSTEAKGKRLSRCLGGLFRCLNCFCGGKKWGGDLKNKDELKDVAVALMELTNNESSVDLVLSDIYVGAKLLRRQQAEQQVEVIQKLTKLHRASSMEEENEDERTSQSISEDQCLRTTLQKTKKQRSVLTLQATGEDAGYTLVEKTFLSSSNTEDVHILQKISHYSIYAQYAYYFKWVISNHFGMDEDTKFFTRDPTSFFTLDTKFSLGVADPSLDHAFLMYTHLDNGLTKTPYAVLLDNDEKTVVITIRGTNSLEDWVIDLQFNPEPLDRVGELCGFDGGGHHVHRGILTRCKWVYNDIKGKKVLKRLYSENSPYKDWNLVVVGHSLGGGCAQVLSLMLRPSFPGLKCYAFEPPGCIFDDNLASCCQDFITSIVCNDDVVPRLTAQNLDMLRDDFLDVLAQIKVPKIKAIRDVRVPCSDSHLKMRNGDILCPKAQIDRDTEFWQKVVEFRNERASKNAASMKLYIPGRIIYLVDTHGGGNKYIAYWASRNEFQSIKLSSKMISDHKMHSLVKTLRSLDLDITHNAMEILHPNEFSEKDERVDHRTFICCSMPNGIKRTISTMVLSFAAWILAVLSNESCSFVLRSNLTITDAEMSYDDVTLAYGMWSFIPKSRSEDGRLQNVAYCFPYPREYSPGSYVTTARVFSILSVFVGFVVIGLLLISTAMAFKKLARITTTSLVFAACLFQCLSCLLFVRGNFCSLEQPIDAAGQSIEAGGECHLSTGGFFSIASMVLWLASGLVCSSLICMS